MQVSGLTFTDNIAETLQTWCSEHNYHHVYILCDSNTYEHCYPLIKNLSDKVIVVPAGEANKQLRLLEDIVEQLVVFGAKQQHLLINLGGGVVSDIGGFAASVYRRGMKFINVPTSLMAMADAAIGGKNGVDHRHLKNYIGTFYTPEEVFLSTQFLATLPLDEFQSAWAEMIKTGAILDIGLFKMIEEDADFDQILQRCAACKQRVVQSDLYDQSVRQLLNFGHTIGHAYESYYLSKLQPVKHGIAVAKGMLAEVAIAGRLGLLSSEDCDRIQQLIKKKMAVTPIRQDEWEALKTLLWTDKKNIGSEITFSLPVALGHGKFGIKLSLEEIKI